MQGGGGGECKKPPPASMSMWNSVHGEQSPSPFGPLCWPKFIPQACGVLPERRNHDHLSIDSLKTCCVVPQATPLFFFHLASSLNLRICVKNQVLGIIISSGIPSVLCLSNEGESFI